MIKKIIFKRIYNNLKNIFSKIKRKKIHFSKPEINIPLTLTYFIFTKAIYNLKMIKFDPLFRSKQNFDKKQSFG